jgi:hypothetical protein
MIKYANRIFHVGFRTTEMPGRADQDLMRQLIALLDDAEADEFSATVEYATFGTEDDFAYLNVALAVLGPADTEDEFEDWLEVHHRLPVASA